MAKLCDILIARVDSSFCFIWDKLQQLLECDNVNLDPVSTCWFEDLQRPSLVLAPVPPSKLISNTKREHFSHKYCLHKQRMQNTVPVTSLLEWLNVKVLFKHSFNAHFPFSSTTERGNSLLSSCVSFFHFKYL